MSQEGAVYNETGVKRLVRKHFGWMVLLIIIPALLLSGCGDAKTADGTQDQAKTEDQASSKMAKEELVLAIGYEPENGFDPTTGWGRYGSPLFQSTLLARDHEMNIIYDLATEYSLEPNGLVWTVKIHDDVKFSDGEPLTAEDVVYTFETAAQSGSVIDLNNLEKAEIIDSNTVQFSLKQPQSTFLHALCSLGIVPKHAHGDDYAQHPIGSGPFQLVQWDKGQQIIVEANPYYYGEPSQFKRLTFLFLEEDAAFAAAQAGQVDMAFVLPTYANQEVAGMHLVRLTSVDNRGILFPYVPTGEQTADGYPIGNDVTADIAIRKAINIALDREALVEGVFEGYGTPAYSVCDGLPWFNAETVFEDGDIDKAQQILSDAGWKDQDGDGILEKGDLKAQFTLLYLANDASRQSLSIAIADMLKPLGIQVDLKGESWDGIAKAMYSTSILFGWGSQDPLELYNLYSSTTVGNGWYNTGYYRNTVVDEYMEKALAATSEEEALQYWKLAQWDGKTGCSTLGDAPWAWLVNRDHLYLVRDGLEIGEQAIQPHGHGWPVTANIAQWHW